MTQPTEPQPERNAYELLSTPTLELSDADVELIVADLRKRREQFLQGIADRPAKRSSGPTPDRSPEAKAARTENLLNEIDL